MGLLTSLISRPIVAWLNKERPPPEVPLSDFERIRYEIKPCDVLLVEGRTRVSNAIRAITQSPWSHAALYIGRLHDIEDPKFRARAADFMDGDPEVQLVIESLLGQGTVLRSLNTYASDHVRICRPKGLAYKDSQQAINFAISRIGLHYDVRQVLDLARFIFPWALWPRRWRSSLFAHNAGRPTRTVCSTMIAEAFAYIQFPVLPLVRQVNENEVQLFRRNPKLCTPKDFDYSPYFEIIKYPFIDCCDYGTYRLLPWHGSGALIGEEARLYASPQLHLAPYISGIPGTTETGSGQEELRRTQDPLIEEIANAALEMTLATNDDAPVEELEVEADADEAEKGIAS